MSKDRFSEELFEAITDIDDSFIEEAESNADPKVVSIGKHKKNRYLMLAACFAFIVVVSIPVINLMNGEFGGFATKDEAAIEMEIADEDIADVYDSDSNANVEQEISGSLNGANDDDTSTYTGVSSKTEEFNGHTIHTNYYNGYILDDPAKDPQEVLSLMKVTEIREKSYYIVVVRNERVKVYDAETLEPLVDNEGTSVADVALELDIAC